MMYGQCFLFLASRSSKRGRRRTKSPTRIFGRFSFDPRTFNCRERKERDVGKRKEEDRGKRKEGDRGKRNEGDRGKRKEGDSGKRKEGDRGMRKERDRGETGMGILLVYQ
jgi:hypothetical protein